MVFADWGNTWKHIQAPKFILFALWFTWLLVGSAWYAYDLDVGWAKGFYMAVNVGYSIGWGDIPEAGEPNSQWFSTIFVLFGASFVAAALGFFAQGIVDDKDNWYTNELQRIAHQKFIEENADNRLLLLYEWAKYNVEKVRAIFLWLLFIGIATGAALATTDSWSFIEALYFAVSSLSTGGLYAMPPGSETWKYALCGFYAAFGVPIMGVAMATIATFFISTGSIECTIDKIRGLSFSLSIVAYIVDLFAFYMLENITEEELGMLTKFEIANDDGQIDKSEFIILCMVRTGAASPELIKLIIEYYNELDVDKDGSLSPDEICQRAKIGRSKTSRRMSMELATASQVSMRTPSARKRCDSASTDGEGYHPLPKRITQDEHHAGTSTRDIALHVL